MNNNLKINLLVGGIGSVLIGIIGLVGLIIFMKKKGITIQCFRTNNNSCFKLYNSDDELEEDAKSVSPVVTKLKSNNNEEIHIDNNQKVDKITNNTINKRDNNMIVPLAIGFIVLGGVAIVAVTAGVAAVIYYEYIKVRPATDKELKTYSDADTVTELERIIESYQHTVHQLRAMQASYNYNKMRIESSQIELERKTNKLEEEKLKQNPSQNVIKSLEKGIKENNKIIKELTKSLEFQNKECEKFLTNLRELHEYFKKVESKLSSKYLPSDENKKRIMSDVEIALASKLSILENAFVKMSHDPITNQLFVESIEMRAKPSNEIEMDPLPQRLTNRFHSITDGGASSSKDDQEIDISKYSSGATSYSHVNYLRQRSSSNASQSSDICA